MNKLKLSSLLFASALALVGCGGSDDEVTHEDLVSGNWELQIWTQEALNGPAAFDTYFDESYLSVTVGQGYVDQVVDTALQNSGVEEPDEELRFQLEDIALQYLSMASYTYDYVVEDSTLVLSPHDGREQREVPMVWDEGKIVLEATIDESMVMDNPIVEDGAEAFDGAAIVLVPVGGAEEEPAE